MEITFEQLPQAVGILTNEIRELKQLFIESRGEPQRDPDKWFDIVELCDYLPDRPAVPTIYGKVHFNQIPYHKTPGQKKLRFLKSEIDTWLKEGRRKTQAETASEADNYIKKGLNNGR